MRIVYEKWKTLCTQACRYSLQFVHWGYKEYIFFVLFPCFKCCVDSRLSIAIKVTRQSNAHLPLPNMGHGLSRSYRQQTSKWKILMYSFFLFCRARAQNMCFSVWFVWSSSRLLRMPHGLSTVFPFDFIQTIPVYRKSKKLWICEIAEVHVLSSFLILCFKLKPVSLSAFERGEGVFDRGICINFS